MSFHYRKKDKAFKRAVDDELSLSSLSDCESSKEYHPKENKKRAKPQHKKESRKKKQSFRRRNSANGIDTSNRAIAAPRANVVLDTTTIDRRVYGDVRPGLLSIINTNKMTTTHFIVQDVPGDNNDSLFRSLNPKANASHFRKDLKRFVLGNLPIGLFGRKVEGTP